MDAPAASSKAVSHSDRTHLAPTAVQGVYLKNFEQALADLLPHVTPQFHLLPLAPLDTLPPSTTLTGKRAERKKGQIKSLLQCIMAMLPEKQNATIVDFCGGTGHLALPLASLLPHCKIVVVDLSAKSLQLLHEKANSQKNGSCMNKAVELQKADVTYQECIERQCAGILNLFTFHGSIDDYKQDFDIGVALHACGEASDITLRACARVGANFCVAPCCVGKLHLQRKNPYIYHATSRNEPTISYPQSPTFKTYCTHWNDLVRAADYSELAEVRTPRNATRRTAKAMVETDRLLYMQCCHDYQTALTRMDPWESSPKNDILLGWRDDDSRAGVATSPYRNGGMEPDDDANADIILAKKYLVEQSQGHGVDWTAEEEADVRVILHGFIASDEREFTFPCGMGSRRRKLIHHLAESMGLAHWGHGKKYSEKTVIVAKKRKGGSGTNS